MQRVVVAGAAGEGEAAGHREGPRRIVECEAELGGGDLDRDREAGVEVDEADVVDREAGVLESRAAGGAERRRSRELAALGDVPALVCLGAGPGEYPALAGNAGGLGGLGARHDQGGRLVDPDVRGEELRVRGRDDPVVRRRRRDLGGAAGLPQPGVRISGRDLREARPELGDPAEVCVGV